MIVVDFEQMHFRLFHLAEGKLILKRYLSGAVKYQVGRGISTALL